MAEEKKIPSAKDSSVGAEDSVKSRKASATLGDESSKAQVDAAGGKTDKAEQKINITAVNAEDEERLREVKKRARLVAEQKLAAYEYAHNYRKKLQRDKERQKTQAKLKREEELAAIKEQERLELERQIEEALAEERLEAEKRNERVSAVLDAVKSATADTEESVAEQNALPEELDASADMPESVGANENDELAAEEAESDAAIAEMTGGEEQDGTENGGEPTVLWRDSEKGSELVGDGVIVVHPDGDEPVEDEGEHEHIVKVNDPDKLAKFSEDDSCVEVDNPDELAKFHSEHTDEPHVLEVVEVIEDFGADTEDGPSEAEPLEDEEVISRINARTDEAPTLAIAKKPFVPNRQGEERTPVDAEAEYNKGMERLPKRQQREREDIPPYEVEDDIVKIVKAKGLAVVEYADLKPYLKFSDDAIKKLVSDVNSIEKKMYKRAELSGTPELIVDMLIPCAKILEIRCDNLSVAARVGAKKESERLSLELSNDIERHNKKAAMFTALTGEKLTRVSAFLPDHLESRTGKAVIPHLSYRENYVEVEIDELGLPKNIDEKINTEIIPVPVKAEELLGEIRADSSGECNTYYKKAERARRRFDQEITALERERRKNGALYAQNVEFEKAAEKKRECAIIKLHDKFPKDKRDGKKYNKKLDKINNRYEKSVLKARQIERESEFTKRELRLSVEMFAIEREKVVAFESLVRDIRKLAKDKSLIGAKKDLTEQMRAFNARSEQLTKALDKEFTKLSGTLADTVSRGADVPLIAKPACRHELIETVGDTERIVGDRVKKVSASEDVVHRAHAHESFDKDKTIEDRALLREQIVIKAMRLLSESVKTRHDYNKYIKKAKRTEKKLWRGLRQTNKAIFKAVDRNGVLVAIVENLRIQSKLVELRAINLETAVKVKAPTGKLKAALTEAVDRYNTRALDYQSLEGVKITRISAFLPENIADGTAKSVIPALSYQETYFEVYPKNNEGAVANTASAIRRGEAYIPLDYKHRRITENPTVEVTEINPPITAEERIDKEIADTRAELWSLDLQRFSATWRLNRRLRFLARKQRRNDRRSRRFDKKLAKLNKKYDVALFKLESLISSDERSALIYRGKMRKLTDKYKKQTTKLRYKRIKSGIERYAMKLQAESFAICREKVAILVKYLYNMRAYGKPAPVSSAKRMLVDQIREYNLQARAFSRVIDEPITEISSSIVDEILRNGREYQFPKVICGREIIESIGEQSRILGDKYRFGMPVRINAKGIPVMKGTSFVVPGVGSPHVGLRSDGAPVIGSTDTGLPYAGAPDKSLVEKARVNPSALLQDSYAAYSKGESLNNDEVELDSRMETAVAAEIDDLDKLIGGAIKAKSRAVTTWREYVRYMRKSRKVEATLRKIIHDHEAAIHGGYDDLRVLNDRLSELESVRYADAKERLERAKNAVEELSAEKSDLVYELENTSKAHNRDDYRRIEMEIHTVEAKIETAKERLKVAETAMAAVEGDVAVFVEKIRHFETVLPKIYIRLLSAKGRLVELGCMNMVAVSKIEISNKARFLLSFTSHGTNPKKKTHKRLSGYIDDYNDLILEDPESRVFTPVSVMLPDRLAQRDAPDEIPDLIFREEFIERKESDGDDEKVARVETPALRAKLSSTLEINNARAYKKYMKSYKRLVKEVKAKQDSIDALMRRSQEKLDDVRHDKIKVSSRYERALIRISRRTGSTAAYQRKLRRRLNRYRNRMFKLERRERTPRINVRQWIKKYYGYNDQGLMYGLAGEVRAASVKILNLERARLLAACEALLKLRGATASKAQKYRAAMKKELINAMVKYNRSVSDCSKKIREPLTRVDSMLPAMILRKGIIPEIPEVVCKVQVLEAVGDERFELK